MSVFIRGVKNAVRNPVRTTAVVILLGVAMAFALSLLLANQAVQTKLAELKANGATTLVVSPAGQGMGPGSTGGGEPLTDAMYQKLGSIAHVSETGATLRAESFRRNTTTSESGDSTEFTPPTSQIDLESPIDAGTLGRRQFGSNSTGTGAEAATDFKLPVQATGVDGTLDASGNSYSLTDGNWFSGASNEAVLGTTLASHNNLKVGSTFTAYDQTFTVVGIYDGGSDFTNAGVLMPLKTLQTLSSQTGEVSSIIVKVDSLENVDATKAAITSALGSDAVEVTSSAQNIDAAISSLESIQKISIAGAVIAVVAAAVIVFMVMLMIVRERKREIAVLKAVGASNTTITLQFVTEAVTLTLCSVGIGLLLALASSNGLTKLLISSNTTDASASQTQGGFRRMPGGPGQATQTSAKDLLSDVKTTAGATLLAEGLAAVVIIGILGSAIPAYTIAKIRPAEVMRGE